MAEIDVTSSTLGNALTDLLVAPDIEPGAQPSYELCKTLWLYHPLGKKIVEGPIVMAQSQKREISVPDSPEDKVKEQFQKQWDDDHCDDVIYNLVAVARAYGLGSVGLKIEGVTDDKAVDWWKLPDQTISFSVFDPLNTAGSLVLNQDPDAIDFLKWSTIAISGKPYHRSSG